jgi:hypothetical protein
VKVSRRESVIGLKDVMTPLLISPFANAPIGDRSSDDQGPAGRRVGRLGGRRELKSEKVVAVLGLP